MTQDRQAADVLPLPTGIPGLDLIVGGGLPRNRLYLVQGTPGAGKTTLALQFLLEGVRAQEPCLYITLSEHRQEVIAVAATHGWSLDAIEVVDLDAAGGLFRGDARTTVFHSSEMELNTVTRLIGETAGRIRPTRVVFDSLSEYRLLAQNALRYRHQLLEFKRLFNDLGSTVLLVDDRNYGPAGEDPHVLSLAHGVIDLEKLAPVYGVPRRRLEVSKLRGVRYREGFHDYVIETGGMHVFPRLIAAEHHTPFRSAPIASGNESLDNLLGGGPDRATTTLIMGTAGTGKSSLSLMYAWRMAEQGEKVMLHTFEETQSIALARATALGWDLTPHLASGRIAAQQIDPAEISSGAFAHLVREGVEGGARMVVIDSLNAYLHAMPGEDYLLHHLHELSSYLNQQGVVTLMTLAMHGLEQAHADIELTYLADTVMHLRFFEAFGEVRSAIAVAKKRSGTHEHAIREMRLVSGRGIEIGEPLKEFVGVLSGRPQYVGASEAMLGG